MKRAIRAFFSMLIAVPLSIIAFIVVAGHMILREPDGSQFIDGEDDDGSSGPPA